ncbi:MAG: DUF4440 domain-containing protein [Thermoplasmata archaeon]|nr:MAG: DUF4440 domain-containing protein [Thermoplasmata archaeon]
MVAEEVGVKPLSDEDVAVIKTLYDEWDPAVKSRDWDTVENLYTEDTVVMPPNMPLVEGREAVKVFFENYPPLKEMSFSPLEIDGYGDIAYVSGTYSMIIQPEGAPEPIHDTGKYLEIRRKQEDGSWLLAIDIFNSDLPLPAPAEKE